MSRSFTSKFEEKRFMNHLINSRYEKVLILWGDTTLIELVEWYQHIELFDEAAKVINCLKVYSNFKKDYQDHTGFIEQINPE